MSVAGYRRPLAASRGATTRHVSPLFLSIATVCVSAGAALWFGFGNQRLCVVLFVLAAWQVVTCVHEYAHALVAYHGGDHTVANKGYLTLSPIRYGHPILTIVFPVLALLLNGVPLPGGAVWIETRLMRTRARDSMMSAVGPLVNALVAAGLLVLLRELMPHQVLVLSNGDGSWRLSPHDAMWATLCLLAFAQTVVVILNLLPVPGLDGYGIIEPWLPVRWRARLAPFQPYVLLIVLALLFTHPVSREFSRAADWFVGQAGVSSQGPALGYELLRFWH